MNGQQIMNQVIADSTPELDELKASMAAVLDGMTAMVPAAREKGLTDLDIKAQADMVIRRQYRKISNNDNNELGFPVIRNGQTAYMVCDVNAIVNLFNRSF